MRARALAAPLSSSPQGPVPPVTELWDSTRDLAAGVLMRKRASLARAITLVESSREDHRRQAELLLDLVLAARRTQTVKSAESTDPTADRVPTDPSLVHEAIDRAVDNALLPSEAELDHAKKMVTPDRDLSNAVPHAPDRTFRIGVAGPPGAGKSTFIEAMGMHLVRLGFRVGVLAIDPSSSRSGGSILGDITRMTELSRQPNAYVRPSPTRGTLGGVAEHSNEVVLLCEGAGYDIVLVETVGLGQSEIVIDDTVDMLLLLMPPAGGDELQGVKKGIMEVADLVVVNKADGDLIGPARHAASEYRRALQLTRRKHNAWEPKVRRCSAAHNDGVERVWTTMLDFWRTMEANGHLSTRRGAQNLKWLWSQLESRLVDMARKHPGVQGRARDLRDSLITSMLSPRRGALMLLEEFLRDPLSRGAAMGNAKKKHE